MPPVRPGKIHARCQPTYEELKRQTEGLPFLSAARCQPTYEELKQVERRHFFVRPVGCQPTYEELKLELASW